MNKGDKFYITDEQTNTILVRTVLDVVDGKIHYNFRDETVQRTDVSYLLSPINCRFFHQTTESAKEAVRLQRIDKANELRAKADKLYKRASKLEKLEPVFTGMVGTYKELEKIGKSK